MSKVKANPKFGVFSFFTGAGFLDLGFEDAGFKPFLANEIDPNFASVYRYSHEKMRKPLPVYGIAEGNVCSYLDDENTSNDLAAKIKQARRAASCSRARTCCASRASPRCSPVRSSDASSTRKPPPPCASSSKHATQSEGGVNYG